jgi:alanine dehydrogenase
MVVRPGVKQASIVDLDKARAEEFKKYCADQFGLNATIAGSITEACEGADVINCTTSSRKPIVMKSDVPKGAHINAIGADAKGKEELDPEILKSSKVVIDDWVQASHSGEINVPVHHNQFSKADIAAELGQVVAKKMKVRTSDDDITVFDSTGLAVQDLMTAWHIYKKLVKEGDPSAYQTVQIFA